MPVKQNRCKFRVFKTMHLNSCLVSQKKPTSENLDEKKNKQFKPEYSSFFLRYLYDYLKIAFPKIMKINMKRR